MNEFRVKVLPADQDNPIFYSLGLSLLETRTVRRWVQEQWQQHNSQVKGIRLKFIRVRV